MVDLTKKSHLVVKLELVGTWNEDEAVLLVREEKDIGSLTAVKSIHKKLNHKTKEQMFYAFKNAGKLDKDVKKTIEDVVENCEICKRNSKSKPKPTVAIPRATDFNSIVSFDLKTMGKKYILWMICTFTKFIKGVVVNDKNPQTIVKALHNSWCMEIGFPTIGWWCDNGGEFRNATMEEFVNKLGLTINFTPSYSPWSNGVNERNHYSCDVIIKKIMEESKKVTLQEAVSMASWTHNTNQNTLGYSPLQLVTGKSIVLPGLSNGNMTTESLYDDEAVRGIMERHHEILKDYREVEFTKKLERAKETRAKGYEDTILKEGDVVFYQAQGKKSWLGPERIFAVKNNSIFIIANGSMKKIPRSNVQFIRREVIDDDKGINKDTPLIENSVSFEIEDEKDDAIENEQDQDTPDEFGDELDSEDIKEIEADRRKT